MTDDTALQNFCRGNDLPWSDRRAERFDDYLALLLKFNKSMNLIGPLDRRQIVDTLLIDSLTAAAVCPPSGPILDVGTGAGLPGIPLAITYPDTPATLVEPRKKRHTFLKIARQRLGLETLELERCRLEEFDTARQGDFGYVISKAFRNPAQWVELAAPWRRDDGVIVCLTRPGEREEISRAAEGVGLSIVDGCDDAAGLGAPSVDPKRAVYVVGAE